MKRKVYSQHKVRTSTQDRTLDSMFPLASQKEVASSSDVGKTMTKGREIKESECLLTSVKDLRKKVQKGKHRRELLVGPLLWMIKLTLSFRVDGDLGEAHLRRDCRFGSVSESCAILHEVVYRQP